MSLRVERDAPHGKKDVKIKENCEKRDKYDQTHQYALEPSHEIFSPYVR
jgi:hypothetical protein